MIRLLILILLLFTGAGGCTKETVLKARSVTAAGQSAHWEVTFHYAIKNQITNQKGQRIYPITTTIACTYLKDDPPAIIQNHHVSLLGNDQEWSLMNPDHTQEYPAIVYGEGMLLAKSEDNQTLNQKINQIIMTISWEKHGKTFEEKVQLHTQE